MSDTQDDLDDLPDVINAAMSLDGDVDKLRDYYDNWAATYNVDLAPGYQMPGMVVRTLQQAIDAHPELAEIREADARIVDAGYGTGAVGAELDLTKPVNVELAQSAARLIFGCKAQCGREDLLNSPRNDETAILQLL